MPDLEAQIAEWRRQMARGGVHGTEVLEELEEHLRDDIEAQIAGGMAGPKAFAAGVAHLGRADLLKREFDKVGGTGRSRVKSLFLFLAGIPSSYQTTTMNMTDSPSNLEPRWATYAKAAVFIAPAVFMWTFSVLFLVPKLQHICQQAGVTLPWFHGITTFLGGHPLLMLLAVVLPFVLLEWRWSRWPQFRRVSLGGAVFLLNAAVMALITLMVIFALYAAPQLMSRG
jgi:hypothetical protein